MSAEKVKLLEYQRRIAELEVFIADIRQCIESQHAFLRPSGAIAMLQAKFEVRELLAESKS